MGAYHLLGRLLYRRLLHRLEPRSSEICSKFGLQQRTAMVAAGGSESTLFARFCSQHQILKPQSITQLPLYMICNFTARFSTSTSQLFRSRALSTNYNSSDSEESFPEFLERDIPMKSESEDMEESDRSSSETERGDTRQKRKYLDMVDEREPKRLRGEASSSSGLEADYEADDEAGNGSGQVNEDVESEEDDHEEAEEEDHEDEEADYLSGQVMHQQNFELDQQNEEAAGEDDHEDEESEEDNHEDEEANEDEESEEDNHEDEEAEEDDQEDEGAEEESIEDVQQQDGEENEGAIEDVQQHDGEENELENVVVQQQDDGEANEDEDAQQQGSDSAHSGSDSDPPAAGPDSSSSDGSPRRVSKLPPSVTDDSDREIDILNSTAC